MAALKPQCGARLLLTAVEACLSDSKNIFLIINLDGHYVFLFALPRLDVWMQKQIV